VTARGEGDIVLSTARTRAGVLLAIVDSGGGFPEGIIQRAFEPYVTTKPRGTGLASGDREEDHRRASRHDRTRQSGIGWCRGEHHAAAGRCSIGREVADGDGARGRR
jgi:hypothetical protein